MDKWCSFPDCKATYKANKWGQIKAHDAGWFFQKDGQGFCPEHVPEWVAGWRAGKAQVDTRQPEV